MFIARISRSLLVPLAAASALSLVLVDQASAQTTRTPPPSQPTTTVPGHWTLTPFIGVGFSGDVDGGTSALGVAAGYAWTDRMTFEGEFSILPSSSTSALLDVETNVWTLTGNALYHFSSNGRNFKPYGVFGLGFGHGSADVENAGVDILSDSSTHLVVNFGGGVERRFTDRMGFRGELRYFFGGDLVPDYWRLGAGLNIDLGRRP